MSFNDFARFQYVLDFLGREFLDLKAFYFAADQKAFIG